MPQTGSLIALFVLLLAGTTCDKHEQNAMRDQLSANQQAARKKLEDKGVSYNQDAFYERVKNGDAFTVELFLAAGMNPNTRYEANTTVLMKAAAIGRADLVALLIDKGANVNGTDHFGRSALTFAIQDGAHTDIVRLLLKNGADPNVKLNDGRTPLLFTVDSPDIVRALLEKGADVNVRNLDTGETPLMLAVLAGDIESLKAILGKKSDVNAKDNRGVTALMFAANNNKTAIAKLLLEKGADVNARTNDGDTALRMAQRQRFSKMIKLLKNAGAT